MTHLKYADDILIFCGSEEDQLQYLRVILVLFEGILRLHMTWRKSFQYHITDVANMETMNIMLCPGGIPSCHILGECLLELNANH